MAIEILNDVEFLFNQFRVTSFMNAAALTHEAEALDETVMGMQEGGTTTRARKAGLRSWNVEIGGFADTTLLTGSDEVLFDAVQVASAEVSILPDGDAVGQIAYAGQATGLSYAPGATVGELMGFTFVCAGDKGFGLNRGLVMADAVQQVASYAPAKQQVGAILDSERMKCFLHIIEFDGTTLDGNIRSDVDASAGGETTEGAFTQFTDVGSEVVNIDGAVTNTFWDVDFTFVGTTFTAVVVYVRDLTSPGLP